MIKESGGVTKSLMCVVQRLYIDGSLEELITQRRFSNIQLLINQNISPI